MEKSVALWVCALALVASACSDDTAATGGAGGMGGLVGDAGPLVRAQGLPHLSLAKTNALSAHRPRRHNELVSRNSALILNPMG